MNAGPTAHRFPLVARSRPLCTGLSARIGALADLADRAHRDNDPTAASRVYNQAALIASDSAQPDLARHWCHRHARAWLHHDHLATIPARHALEPLVNLARLHIRVGDHDDGFQLINDLYHAVAHRTDTVIDGIPLPAAALTPTDDSHRELVRWLWGVHLADGTRALTSAGRWNEAEAHLQQHHGIGHRMLDGRQVAIIARITRNQHTAALQMIDQTHPGEPWEAAVTACLTAMSQPNDPPPPEHTALMTQRYHDVALDPSQIVFHTRLALTIIELTGGISRPDVAAIAQRVVRAAVSTADGYAARDILTHAAWAQSLEAEPRRALTEVLNDSGHNHPMPAPLIEHLTATLGRCEATIRQCCYRTEMNR
ncbi:hypothetical protein ACLQ24_00480 [Micromonospora sp. DT4]|uniref:hypothetical protein n=1 Tax=Micromonospora sp. DT4 TaxID=3393438 RepID=UPI003CE6F26B